MASQSSNGKAFEYAFLESLNNALSSITEVTILPSPQLDTARNAFNALDQQVRNNMLNGARSGIDIILRSEPRLRRGQERLELSILPDAAGRAGDVRDVLAVRADSGWEIGISCKNNHSAVKHSRLSNTIDIGASWLGLNSTPEYFNEIQPIFDELSELRKQEALWRDLQNKEGRFYRPILEALRKELLRLDESNPNTVPRNLLSYLLGRNDFYKVITTTRSRTTEVQAFNINGSLNQREPRGQSPQNRVPRIGMPFRIYDIHYVRQDDGTPSNSTLIVALDEGWSLSMRIHNASSKVEPSLKLDVQITGLPPSLFRQVTSWDI